MKIIAYDNVAPTRFDGGPAQGVDGRVVIGQADGAPNFCMRVFELEPGGHTPRHRHDWEHEIFFHAGRGEVRVDDAWHPVNAGHAAFIPGGREHQIRNPGPHRLTFVCLVPAGAPEL